MRASDADRERVLEALQRHTAAGRLTLDEFAERAGAVHAARTWQELAVHTADLPAEEASPEGSRQLVLAFAVAVVTIALLGLLYALLT